MKISFQFFIFYLFINAFCYAKAEESTWSGSIMFSVTDNRRIHELLEENSIKKPIIEEENKEDQAIEKFMETVSVKNTDVKDLPKEAPTFYLNSILYIDKNDWTVWINGQNISNNSENDKPKIKEVTRNYAVLFWESKYFKYINPEWDSKYGEGIEVDKANNRVYFTLYPNQTFVTKTMEIVEGKREPTPIIYEKIKVTGKK